MIKKAAFRALTGIASALAVPIAASANSLDVQPGFAAVYGFSPACTFCHQSSLGETPTSSSPQYGFALYNRINQVVAADPGFDRNSAADLRQIFEYLEPDYAPVLSTVNTAAASSTSATALSVSPVVGNNVFPVVFSGGTTNTGTSASVNSLATATSLSASTSTLSANATNVTLALSETFVRGRAADRSAVFPIVFTPTNAAGFKPTTTTMVARNTVNVSFSNLAPIGSADAMTESNTTRDGTDWVLDVLANDDDPDSALQAGQTNAPPPRLGCLSTVTTGTLAANTGETALVYTPPAPLPASPELVTFSYCPIDSEGLQGATVTSTILVPAPSAADAPVANDDTFAPIEDTPFAGDVSTNDTTTAAGGALSFALESQPGDGSVSMSGDGTFTYTPPQDFNGSTSFVYRATNVAGFALGTATLNVAPDNDAPVANAAPVQELLDTDANLVIDLLDALYVSDIDGDTLSVTDVRIGPIVESFRAPEEISYDSADLTAVSGSNLTIFPSVLAKIDNGDFVEITISYDVTDGVEQVSPTFVVRINGVDNELGRQPGLYADSISQRYNGHFKGFAQQGEGACLTCHKVGNVDVDVDFRRDCVESDAFNAYGLALCLDRTAGQGALTNLPERMANAEPRFAPILNPPSEQLQIAETAAAGAPVGAPLSVSQTGLTVDGTTSQIVTYLLARGSSQAPAQTDASGNFQISDSGQISVAAGAQLTPGPYPLFVMPVNDAGQKDSGGGVLGGLPGFYPAASPTAVTVYVGAVPIEPNPDEVATLADRATTIDVLDNDAGGSATSVAVADVATNGVTAVNSDLTITYTPATGFVGTDSFTYTATNTAGTTAPTLVTVTVLADGNVVAQDDTAITISGAPVTIDVLANDPGAVTSGSGLTTVAIVSAPDAATEGSLTISGQSLVFASVAAFTGDVTARYSATNPGGATTEANVFISVLESGGTVISDTLADPELRKVARSFEQSCELSSDPAFLETCVNLTAAASNGENLASAMRALRNEEHLATVDTTRSIARNFGRGLQKRIGLIRNGGPRGFDMSGLNLTIDGESVPSQFLSDLFSGVLGLSSKDRIDDTAWGFFVSGDISVSEKDSSDNNDGFETTAGNMLIGMDYELDPRRSIGVALGYTTAETDFSGGGSLDTRAVQASVYGRVDDALGEGIDFDGYLSVGRLKFNSDRRILFTANGVTVDSMAEAEFEGTYLNVVPTLSFSEQLGRYGDPLGDIKTGAELRWKIGLDYLRLHVDGYTEEGGAGLGLTTQSETYESLLLFVGVDARRPIWLSPRVASEIRGGITLRSELMDETRSVTSSFAAAGNGAPTFTVTEDGANGLGGTIDLGLTLGLDPGELAIDYSYDFSSDGIRTHGIAVGYSQSFGRRGQLDLGMRRNFSDDQDGSLDAEARYTLNF